MGFYEHRAWDSMYTGNGILCTWGLGIYVHREWDSMYTGNGIICKQGMPHCSKFPCPKFHYAFCAELIFLFYATETYFTHFLEFILNTPSNLEVRYDRYLSSRIHFMRPEMLKMMKSLGFYPCKFWQHLELCGNKKNCCI